MRHTKANLNKQYQHHLTELAFHIRALSRSLPHSPHLDSEVHRSEHYGLILVLRGRARHWLNFEQQTLQAGDLLCIKPGQYQKLELDDLTEGYHISFDSSFLGVGEQETDVEYRTALLQAFEYKRIISIPEQTKSDMADFAARMLEEFNNTHVFKTELLRRYLKVFLVYLARQTETLAPAALRTKTSELVDRFFTLLHRTSSTKRLVGDYALQLCVTANYLNEIVKKNTGYPAGYHVRQRIVLEAKRMATYSNACTKEIAYGLGFSDMAHFSKFFKQYTGSNFSDFKKSSFSAILT